MPETVLVAPADSAIANELMRRLLENGAAVCAGFCGESEENDLDEEYDDDLFRRLRWDPRSFISAKNIVLTALNTFERLDCAMIVHAESSYFQAHHVSTAATIEKSVDVNVKGTALLAKELLALFVKQRFGRLSMVLFAPDELVTSPIANATSASFLALTESLWNEYQNEPIAISAFESRKNDPEGFAAFTIDTIADRREESSGKPYRYGTKIGFKRR